MTKNEIIQKLESAGYTVKPHAKHKKGIVIFHGAGGRANKGERVSLLKEVVAPMLGGKWRQNTTIKSSVGGVVVGQFIIVTKPEADVKGSLSSLDARIFASLGKNTVFDYGDEKVKAVEFRSAKKIEESILIGIDKASMLNEGLIESFSGLFKDGPPITWSPSTTEATKNKLGVYIGELLIGVVGLSGSSYRTKYLTKNIFGSGRAKRFLMPTDPAFSGVDSFIEMADGEMFPISSKFGVGAKASIFSNLMPKAHKKYNKLGNSEFKKLVKIIVDNKLKPTDSRSIVYHYGIRNILKIPKSKIKDPNAVYQQLRTGKHGPEAKIAIGVATGHKMLPSNIKKFKPENMSHFFNRVIAEKINKDKKSLDQIKSILAGKQYWQLNLNKTKWSKGFLEFNAVLSGKASCKFIGNKSTSNDISSKQGWVNYELKVK